jgi:hypothetical protein
MHSPRPAVALLITLAALGACADMNWERSVYEGMRRGADNAAQRPGSTLVPQPTTLPEYTQYERERQRLMTPDPTAAKSSSPR